VPGGKGANQAVACARLGAYTRMVGRVGDDVFGATLIDSLRGYGVDATGVAVSPGPSGLAIINVDDRAENNIVIIAGANGLVGAQDLARLEALLRQVSVLMLQLEIPMEAVVRAAKLARAQGVRVVVDPAPAKDIPAELYALADVLTPNETEATALAGSAVTGPETAERAARQLLERGARQVIIKLGGQGAYAHDGRQGFLAPAFPVKAVDSVAAGDAFNGGVAVALAEGHAFEVAVRWGMAAGAVAVTRPGAQPAMPSREDMAELLG
jgi:ribokinase